MDALEVFTDSSYLSRLIEKKIPCTVIMTNGYQMHDVVFTKDGGNAVAMKAEHIREQMVYKHAISTIRPPYPLCDETTVGDSRAGSAV